MLISGSTSLDKNYAKVENGEVVVSLNEYTKNTTICRLVKQKSLHLH